jgi:hypothetical protein
MTETKDLSDEELADVLAGKAFALREGRTNRRKLRNELAMLLASETGVVVRPEALKSQGRQSFGRSNEGREGLSLFVPHDDRDQGGAQDPADASVDQG